MSAIRNEIENISAFNSGRQREKVLNMLLKWYPQINAFENKLKPFEQQIKILEDNQRVIENQSRSKDARVYRTEQKMQDLNLQLQEYQEFVSSIPPEIFNQLKQQYRELHIKQDNPYISL